MNPQLQELIDEFHRATERLEHLDRRVPPNRFGERPDPLRWSVGDASRI